jgi:cellulose biosynthesis protein BcsQ
MNVIALYNMKGGVGKTTTAVNLSYLAAAHGQRTLLWDLDPQAASSYAFRVRSGVVGFDRKNFESGEALAAAIKETDFTNLDLLPADFAYRKLDRMLADLDKPKRVVTKLLQGLGRDYVVFFLDCPAGFSLMTEGLFAAANTMLVPTIPTVLSLRTLAQLFKWADRSDSRTRIRPFFSMVDRRKTLHRQACEWSSADVELFLSEQIPYASVVEQMAIRRMPLAVFAPRDPATLAFAGIWQELEAFRKRDETAARTQHHWTVQLRAIESLIARLEPAEEQGAPLPEAKPALIEAVDFVHTFDTPSRDLQRCGYALQLLERAGSFIIVAGRLRIGRDGFAESVEIRIDAAWAAQILSGAKSPMTVLERRLSPDQLWLHQDIRATIGAGQLRRVDSNLANATSRNDSIDSKPHDPRKQVIAGDGPAAHH